MLNQVTQHIEGLRRKRYPVFTAPQALVRRIKPEWLEQLHLALSRRAMRRRTTAEYEVFYGTAKAVSHCLGSTHLIKLLRPVTEIRLKSHPYVTFSLSRICNLICMRAAFVVRLRQETNPLEAILK